MEKACITCEKIFKKKINCSKKKFEERKYCSFNCYWEALKNKEIYAEWRNKLSQAHKGKAGYWTGKKRPPFSEQWKNKMSKPAWNKGKKMPEITGRNHPQWREDRPTCIDCGKENSQYYAKRCKTCFQKYNRGENHGMWKGDQVGFGSLHQWVSRKLGRPKYCEHCKRSDLKKYEWANKSREYKRDIYDWIRLCKKCHNKYDTIPQKIWKTRKSSKSI